MLPYFNVWEKLLLFLTCKILIGNICCITQNSKQWFSNCEKQMQKGKLPRGWKGLYNIEASSTVP